MMDETRTCRRTCRVDERSEEHTSELQSPCNLVCRLLLEKKIDKVIRTFKSALMERVPLIDEIVVVDSGSTDRTAAIAERAGVTVVQHSEILPRYCAFKE